VKLLKTGPSENLPSLNIGQFFKSLQNILQSKFHKTDNASKLAIFISQFREVSLHLV
jgi:hypothetical protein